MDGRHCEFCSIDGRCSVCGGSDYYSRKARGRARLAGWAAVGLLAAVGLVAAILALRHTVNH